MAGSHEEGYRINREFVLAMLEEFKAQRQIHPRFATEIVLAMGAQLRELPTLVDVHIPNEASFTVCGVCGHPPTGSFDISKVHIAVHMSFSCLPHTSSGACDSPVKCISC